MLAILNLKQVHVLMCKRIFFCCGILQLGLTSQQGQAAEQEPTGQDVSPLAEGEFLLKSDDTGIVDSYEEPELPDGLGGWQTIPPAQPPGPESARALEVRL